LGNILHLMLKHFALSTAVAFCTACPAFAGPYDDIVSLEVLPGWETQAGTRMTGFRLTLKPGWKTYWRSPGVAGIPPVFHWSGSRNLDAVQMHWPVPEVFYQSGMRSIGYENVVTIPVEVHPKSDGPVRMQGQLEIGVCEDICIPVAMDFELLLNGQTARDPQLIAALIDQPYSASDADVRQVTCRFDPTEAGLQMTAEIELPPTGGSEVVVIESTGSNLWVSEADAERRGERLIAVADIQDMSGGPIVINRSDLRLTVLGAQRAVDIRGCAAG
jgi:DsbC/DsbD-like thiol-disulfide interchange protein